MMEKSEMSIGVATAVCKYIFISSRTDEEKIEAIRTVINMETHNGITKDVILNAFRWFFNWAVEESSKKQTNADRIRNMDDEELKDIILCPYDTAGSTAHIMPCVRDGNIQESVPLEDCNKCILERLRRELEEI